MRRTFLKCKIHRCRVTEADLEYEGSLTVDGALLEAAGLKPFERIEIYNVTRGSRFETYLMEGEWDSGTICVNGAAAHLAGVGDIVIICAYLSLELDEIAIHRPVVIHVDEANRVSGKTVHEAVLKRSPRDPKR